MNEVRARTTLEGLLVVGLLAALGCGGGSGRTTDGGGADTARGTGGGGAKDAATDRHEATDRTSAGDRSSTTDMRPASDARRTGDGACGALGQPCCPDGTCQGDRATNVCAYLLIPNDYTCIHCGGLNEPCCQNQYCNDSTLACDNAGSTLFTCKTCGLTGNPCCGAGTSTGVETGTCRSSTDCCSDEPPNGRCVTSGSTCYMNDNISAGICAAGSCECGHENEPCCDYGGNTCLDANDQCMIGGLTDVCKPCGVPGNPCCPNNTCATGGCCVYEYTTGSICVANGATCQTTPTATCNAGTCGSCGGVGQACCASPDNICTAPNTYCSSPVNAGTCQSCGAAGEPCCAGASFLATGTSCNRGLTCSSTSQATGGICH